MFDVLLATLDTSKLKPLKVVAAVVRGARSRFALALVAAMLVMSSGLTLAAGTPHGAASWRRLVLALLLLLVPVG